MWLDLQKFYTCIIDLQLSNYIARVSYHCTYMRENFSLMADSHKMLCLVKVAKSDACIRLFCKSGHLYFSLYVVAYLILSCFPLHILTKKKFQSKTEHIHKAVWYSTLTIIMMCIQISWILYLQSLWCIALYMRVYIYTRKFKLCN